MRLELQPVDALAEKDDLTLANESSRSSASPSVVLPDPDSPTTPTVSPSRTVTLTSSTALTKPTVRRKKPRLIGNHTRIFSATTTGFAPAIGGRRRALRLGGEQRLRIGMARRGEDARDGAGFDDAALLHHGDVVGNSCARC